MNIKAKIKKFKPSGTHIQVLTVLTVCMPKHGGYYTKVSIDKIRKKLKEKFGKVIGRSWCFEIIKDLEDAGLISRKQRRGRNSDGKVWQNSSIIAFLAKGARYLITACIIKGHRILKAIEVWSENPDKRFPRGSSTPPWQPPKIKPEGIKGLRTLAEIVASPI